MPRHKAVVLEAPEEEVAQTTETVEDSEMIGAQTDWEAFKRASVKIGKVVCEGYYPYHRYNEGCHTTIVPSVKTMQAHLDGGHGGGFLVTLEKCDKTWEGWKQLKDGGVELMDFMCDVCDQQVKLNPQNIQKHLRAHTNKNRRVEIGGRFYLTLGYGRPEPTDEDTIG